MRLLPRIKQYILFRMPKGCVTEGVLIAYRNYLKYSDGLTMRILYMWLLNYTLGTSYCFRNSAYPTQVTSKLDSPKPLYHMCYRSDLPSIERSGIKHTRGIVYLTDNLELEDDYFNWKDRRVSTPLKHYIVELDTTKLLHDGVTILSTNRDHEYVTENIPADYITKIISFPNRVLSTSM